jgi:hypothetical protein
VRRVGLALLHVEYIEKHPDGYRDTQFCELYPAWLGRRGLTVKLDHRAGDKAFVDYSGVKLHIVDRRTGEVPPVELFVGVLGASNYTFAEATMTQRSPDFIGSHTRMLEYFGGVPAALVPDQLKSGVARSCWYDPKIQRTYEAMAEHYNTTVHQPRRWLTIGASSTPELCGQTEWAAGCRLRAQGGGQERRDVLAECGQRVAGPHPREVALVAGGGEGPEGRRAGGRGSVRSSSPWSARIVVAPVGGGGW